MEIFNLEILIAPRSILLRIWLCQLHNSSGVEKVKNVEKKTDICYRSVCLSRRKEVDWDWTVMCDTLINCEAIWVILKSEKAMVGEGMRDWESERPSRPLLEQNIMLQSSSVFVTLPPPPLLPLPPPPHQPPVQIFSRQPWLVLFYWKCKSCDDNCVLVTVTCVGVVVRTEELHCVINHPAWPRDSVTPTAPV